jgi:hypothetical protein
LLYFKKIIILLFSLFGQSLMPSEFWGYASVDGIGISVGAGDGTRDNGTIHWRKRVRQNK